MYWSTSGITTKKWELAFLRVNFCSYLVHSNTHVLQVHLVIVSRYDTLKKLLVHNMRSKFRSQTFLFQISQGHSVICENTLVLLE